MATEESKALTIKSLFSREDTQKKFQELLGKKAQGFMTSMLQIATNNALLAKADPMSIYNSAMMAATLDLPINQNLGFAYIIPYNSKQPDGSFKQVAQFQIGYKGFLQLAQRSGQFLTISDAVVYEGQLVEENPLEGFRFDWTKKTSDKIIGFAAFIKLLNGFEKTLYMSVERVHAHGKKYSKTYDNKYGLWQTDFESMGLKTVLKRLLSKGYAPLSVEMQKAVLVDQGIIDDNGDPEYVDNATTIVPEETHASEPPAGTKIPPVANRGTNEATNKKQPAEKKPEPAPKPEEIEEATVVPEPEPEPEIIPEPEPEPVATPVAAPVMGEGDTHYEPKKGDNGIAATDHFNEGKSEVDEETGEITKPLAEMTLSEIADKLDDAEAVPNEAVLDYWGKLNDLAKGFPDIKSAMVKRVRIILEAKAFTTVDALKAWYIALPKEMQDSNPVRGMVSEVKAKLTA